MPSTVGRPRNLTDAQVAEILSWHRSRKTIADVARDYGVSAATISAIIRNEGFYKQPSPRKAPRRTRRRAPPSPGSHRPQSALSARLHSLPAQNRLRGFVGR